MAGRCMAGVHYITFGPAQNVAAMMDVGRGPHTGGKHANINNNNLSHSLIYSAPGPKNSGAASTGLSPEQDYAVTRLTPVLLMGHLVVREPIHRVTVNINALMLRNKPS